MNRGDVVLAAAPGDYGKPRPWVVIQASVFLDEHPSVTLCPITTHDGSGMEFRVPIPETPDTGLRRPSAIMADKVQTMDRNRLRSCIGSVDRATLRSLDTALRVWLGLA